MDVSNFLPGLVYRPGMTSWVPSVDRSVITDFATFQGYIQSLPESKREETKMVESHWPPAQAEAEELHLSRWSVNE